MPLDSSCKIAAPLAPNRSAKAIPVVNEVSAQGHGDTMIHLWMDGRGARFNHCNQRRIGASTVSMLAALLMLSSCGRPTSQSVNCYEDTDCGSGQACIEFLCVNAPSGGCLDSSDCSLSHECVEGSCEPSSVPVPSGCSSSAECPSPQYCDLSQGVCVECLLDEHCPLGDTCLDSGLCSSTESPEPDPTEPDEADPSEVGDSADPSDPSELDGTDTVEPEGAEDCVASASDETGALCHDGLDNDCDGEPDRFDASCPVTDCGAPSNYLTTDVCNSAMPEDHGARICETYPHSEQSSGNQELCMDVCRTTSDCEAGHACYISRRSINVHFCAPAPGLRATGESCSSDSDCASATCFEGACREVCVRDADCVGDTVCRATILIPEHLGQEAASGLCLPRNPGLLAPGEPCSSASQCQNGACGQPYMNGGYFCSKICGSDYDCGAGQRCAGAIYSADATFGHGLRTCSYQPQAAISQAGDYCSQAADCTTQICDGTYYRPDGQFLLAPYCNRYCDTNSDCPLLFPGTGPESYNLQMKCIVTSSGVIQPLVGGHCAPWWCNTAADCETGRSCLIFNPTGFDGMPQGICQ